VIGIVEELLDSLDIEFGYFVDDHDDVDLFDNVIDVPGVREEDATPRRFKRKKPSNNQK
jgi:hypothetical protein